MLLAYLLRTRLVGPIPYILFSILLRSNSYRSAQFPQPDSATEGGAAAVQSAPGRLMFPKRSGSAPIFRSLRNIGARLAVVPNRKLALVLKERLPLGLDRGPHLWVLRQNVAHGGCRIPHDLKLIRFQDSLAALAGAAHAFQRRVRDVPPKKANRSADVNGVIIWV